MKIANSLSKSCVAILMLWTILGTCREIACVQYYQGMRRFGMSKVIPYYLYNEKMYREKQIKQQAEDKEFQRRYQIFQTFIKNQGVLGSRTSVLKDFYSGRYR
jgi:hypothetical protein